MNFLLPALGLLALASTPFSACLGQDASDSQDEILEHANKSWTGDLDGMTKRGFVRILTVHNPLFFQFEGASKRGLVEEWGKAFEAHLAEEIGRVRSPTVVLIPVARDELLPGLIEGRGDLVMGNLTITPERQKLVDFGPPIHTDISELVVTGPAAQGVASFDDLVQTGVYVRRSSSYFEHLQGLNAERSAQGKPPIPITEADENLEDYDLLDMVNAGILEAVIVDSHKAALWEQVFDRIEVHRDLVVNSGSRIAWALRKGSPELMRSISAFSAKVKKGSLLGNVLIERYLGDAEWLENALASEDRERYEETIEIIQRYAARYDFDWLIIAAQAYQESRLDQDKRSPAGAIGVMQLLPSTAADAAVAYNAGPGNMQKARRRARRLGFDPNRWFGNVEIGMFRAVSGEPASYVRNIYKYYVTYQGLERSRRAREKALESHRQENASTARTWLAAAALIALLIVLGYRARKRAAASGP
jgi:membrane-bound lytic murein transglycosylase MltF